MPRCERWPCSLRRRRWTARRFRRNDCGTRRAAGWLPQCVEVQWVIPSSSALPRRLPSDWTVRCAKPPNRVIALHGLSGRSADEILARVAGEVDVSRSADVGKSGMIGGLLSGALGGLVADLHAGGLTFGAGALIGGILGALGASGAAQAYNLARGSESGSVGWSAAFLTQRFTAALLRYLAVAHFGRGRGEWVEGEYPAHWQPLAEEVTGHCQAALAAAWARAGEGAAASEIEQALQPVVTAPRESCCCGSIRARAASLPGRDRRRARGKALRGPQLERWGGTLYTYPQVEPSVVDPAEGFSLSESDMEVLRWPDP